VLQALVRGASSSAPVPLRGDEVLLYKELSMDSYLSKHPELHRDARDTRGVMIRRHMLKRLPTDVSLRAHIDTSHSSSLVQQNKCVARHTDMRR
jgi:hypothetical protein